jgi:hypothetical protein
MALTIAGLGATVFHLRAKNRRPQQQEARVETAPVQGTATSPALPGLPPPPVAEEPAKPVAPKPAASAGHRRRHAEPKKIGDALIDPYGL